MSNSQNNQLKQLQNPCGSLLYELQIIWDEVGESEADRDKMLLELEEECLQVYRRKVDHANKYRAQLRQTIAEYEAELAAICSAMGERPVHIRQSDQNAGSLKEELGKILPQLEEMRRRKSERRHQYLEVQEQIGSISNEISSSTEYIPPSIVIDETDLSLKKLEELCRQLHELQKEKSDRVKKIQDQLCTLDSICSVLGMDFRQIANEVHPSLTDSSACKSISNNTMDRLNATIRKLREEKIQRMQKLQDLATAMLELWNLMDTPIEEQQAFQNVTCNIAASEHEITAPNTLSVDFINYVEAEVSRLEELKSSKMKELVLKKRLELEEICRKTHLVPQVDDTVEYAIAAIESGAVDASFVLEQIELQIGKIKEEALSRKEILDKVEKWLGACDEESWLEEYNRDENRYNAGRGAHLTLKRAEKARALVNKIPAMVDTLASKTEAWEKDRGVQFTYDGINLLTMLEDYTILREEKEQERRRLRDQKKLQGQLIAEREAIYGSKPSPSKTQSVKKASRMSTGGATGRRVSLGGAIIQTATPNSRAARKNDRVHQNDPNYFDDCSSVWSSARRGLDVAGTPVKNDSFGTGNIRELESPLTRQPFSPISSTASSNANTQLHTPSKPVSANTPSKPVSANTPSKPVSANTPSKPVGANNMQFFTPSKPVAANNTQFHTPSRLFAAMNEENRTPQMVPIPTPSTPSTLSVPMHVVVTPAPPITSRVDLVQETPEAIEYSFEERRAGFVLPKSHLKSMLHV